MVKIRMGECSMEKISIGKIPLGKTPIERTPILIGKTIISLKLVIGLGIFSVFFVCWKFISISTWIRRLKYFWLFHSCVNWIWLELWKKKENSCFLRHSATVWMFHVHCKRIFYNRGTFPGASRPTKLLTGVLIGTVLWQNNGRGFVFKY